MVRYPWRSIRSIRSICNLVASTTVLQHIGQRGQLLQRYYHFSTEVVQPAAWLYLCDDLWWLGSCAMEDPRFGDDFSILYERILYLYGAICWYFVLRLLDCQEKTH